MGHQAGHRNISSSGNFFLGNGASLSNTISEDNIFIGLYAGNTSDYTDESNKLVIGNRHNKTWIVGTIGEDNLTVNGRAVCLAGL